VRIIICGRRGIHATRGYAILPYPIDRRGEIVPVTGSDLRHYGVKLLPRPVQIAGPHQEQALAPELRKQLELSVMDQRRAL
jgi:hypothetical protein